MRRILFGTLAILATIGFISLGVWQLERRIWKLDLIAQTERRLQANPVAAPSPAIITTKADTYTRLTTTGHFLNDMETPVLAVTRFGRGFWILTPFQTNSGFIVLINRGFVPEGKRAPETYLEPQTTSPTTITGLLRLTEPHGAFLRTNNPTKNQWYSRDVAAIAKAHHLANVTSYFIDATSTSNPAPLPIPGLTVVTFPNNHLSYAFTWFALALISAAMAILIFKQKK